MDPQPVDGTADYLTLKFTGGEENGSDLHELRAAHVAEVLQGIVGLSSDFAKAGAFGDGPAGSDVLVRPAKQGSFIIEVIRLVQDNQETVAWIAGGVGVPSLSQVLWWATKSARADVQDFDYLENGNVKVTWQDDTAQEIPEAAWRELQKRDRRRKKQLRQILAPLSDDRVSSLEVQDAPAEDTSAEGTTAHEQAAPYTLTRSDYDAARPDDDVSETHDIFEAEAQMSAIDFDDPTRWRVRANGVTRLATVEDKDFLGRVAGGLAIRKSDLFDLRIRQDALEKNGRTRRTWTVLEVKSHRRAAHDSDE